MLTADKVTVQVGKKKLLENISLQVKPGELLAVVGPNGAGKSTLLKSFCGELNPASGAVRMNGKALHAWSLSERASLCAVLPQNSSLSFPFSVLDVVLMGRSPHYKAGKQEKDFAIVRQAMKLTGIDQMQERIYTTLSGGERQRVHFARILSQIWEPMASGTRYLMLDEPTSALDLSHQNECLGIALSFAKEQDVGVLTIIHDLNLAALYADRIAILQAGRLIAIDTPSKVLNQEMIQQIFNCPVAVSNHPQNRNCPLVISMLPSRERKLLTAHSIC